MGRSVRSRRRIRIQNVRREIATPLFEEREQAIQEKLQEALAAPAPPPVVPAAARRGMEVDGDERSERQPRVSRKKKGGKTWTDLYPLRKEAGGGEAASMDVDEPTAGSSAKGQVAKRALGIKVGSKVIAKPAKKAKGKGPRGARAATEEEAEKHRHKMKLLQSFGKKKPKQFRKKRG
mmetsp:Transcript_3093/g.11124  ORF Transcript_3093/g.11124 Transcript_3093/m.11124 type:complete len:178 (-) Transcript_3093:181-714(-)